MRIKTVIRNAGYIATAQSIATLGLVYFMNRSIEFERNSEQELLKFHELGHQFGLASDHLTREARQFSITGDIRHYDAYWKEIKETKTRTRVVEQLKALHPSPGELDLIETTKRISDELIKTEIKAMDATKNGDLKLGRALIFTENYIRKKRMIMEPLEEFQKIMSQRVSAEVHEASNKARQFLELTTAAIIAYVVIALAGLHLFFRRGIVTPLFSITSSISKISAGELDTEIPFRGSATEIGDLAKSAHCFKAALTDNVKLNNDLRQHHRHLEREVESRTTQLRQSEARMRQTFESSTNGLAVISEQGDIKMVNSQLMKIFARQREEMLGQPIEFLIPEGFPRKHISFSLRPQNSMENSLKTPDIGPGIELYGHRSDGTNIPLECSLAPLDGDLKNSVLATIQDISERKKTERAIRQKNAQLRRLNTELLEFAYSTSHDLKAPLASITGLLDFCLIDLTDGNLDELQENIAKTKVLSTRLANRVESTLNLAKSDTVAGDWEAITVQQSVEDAWSALPNEGYIFSTSFQHSTPIVTVPARFDAILENLLSNAIKYKDPNKQQNTIRVATWTSGDTFRLSVEDNGIGIPLEHHDKVFRLFHRLASNDTDGTGLGLPLVKKHLTGLGGEIELDCDNSKTTFTIMLPQPQIDTTIDERKHA